MKWIKFTRIVGERNVGTEDNPVMQNILTTLALSYCDYNEEIAKREAYNGEYTVEDDGQPEPVAVPTAAERLEALEAAMLEMMGVAVDG